MGGLDVGSICPRSSASVHTLPLPAACPKKPMFWATSQLSLSQSAFRLWLHASFRANSYCLNFVLKTFFREVPCVCMHEAYVRMNSGLFGSQERVDLLELEL